MNKPKITLKTCDIIGRQYRILFSHALITAKAHNFKTDKVSSYLPIFFQFLPSYTVGALNFIGTEHLKEAYRKAQAQFVTIQNKMYWRMCHTRCWALTRKNNNNNRKTIQKQTNKTYKLTHLLLFLLLLIILMSYLHQQFKTFFQTF